MRNTGSEIPLLMTRPEGQNRRFVTGFPESLVSAVRLVDCPLIEITGVPDHPGVPDGAEAIFTSSNGVRFAPPALGRQAYCVGDRTTQVAAESGWRAVRAGRNAEELLAYLLAHRPAQPLVHLCGVHVRGRVVEDLIDAGLRVGRVVVYDQSLLPLSSQAIDALSAREPVIVPLFSPRAATHFAAVCPRGANVRIVAMSPAVASAASELKNATAVSSAEPDAGSMIREIEKLVETIRLG